MNSSETKDKIFASEDFVISELKKMQTLYGLKKEIRYAESREKEDNTESVAEHVYAMHCVADYFLPLENPEGSWNVAKIHQMIQYHDIDEIETGDVLGYLKTESESANERAASEKVISKFPEIIQESIRNILNEYELQETAEARFVKAIDKIEPVFHLYNEAGKKRLLRNKTTRIQSESIKNPYFKNHAVIRRFHEVTSELFEKEGFFHKEA